jgi:hypothetical protein
MSKTATIQAQQKWEYVELTRKTEAYLIEEINEIGQQGWELVSVFNGKDRKGDTVWIAFLKRPYVAHGSNHHQDDHHHEPKAAATSGVMGAEPKKVIKPAVETSYDDDEFKFREEETEEA